MREEITPDINKAKALFKMADELLQRLKKYPLNEFPSQNLSDLYDIIHMLIDGILISKGIKFKVDGAHFEMIEESKNEKILSDNEEALIQQIRGMRNRYKYEGFHVNKDYIDRNGEKIIRIINKLFEMT